MNKKVLLGMSGGVDSSVSALLLKQKGYDVIGCTMNFLENNGESQEVIEAKKICRDIGIEHYVFDYREPFRKYVIDYFVNEYKKGRTPNPCVECNKFFKFGYFYEKSKELGCDYFATGHYAKIEYSDKYKQKVLKKSKEENKDQTYFLYGIPKERLNNIIFPLQDYTNKEDIRKIAYENGLNVARKKDSQEICFIEDDDYQKFLSRYLQNSEKGNIVLSDGTVLGEHRGLVNYTVGQRKGLGIAYKKPLYVIKLDVKNNCVVVGIEEELYSKKLYVKDLNWLVSTRIEKKIDCYAKIRYRAKQAKVEIEKKVDMVEVSFKEPQRAITPGQSVVFYDKDGVVLGGGKIEK